MRPAAPLRRLGGLWRRSFPVRLGVTTAALFGVLVVAVGAGAFVTTSRGLHHTLDQGLLGAVRALAPRAEGDRWPEWEGEEGDLHELAEHLLPFTVRAAGLHFQLVDGDGILLARSPSLGEAALPLPPDWPAAGPDRAVFATLQPVRVAPGQPLPRPGAARGWAALIPPPGALRAVFYPLRGGEGERSFLVAAAPTGSVRTLLLGLRGQLLVTLLLALATVGAVSTLLAARAFLPLRAVIETAEAIDEATLDSRITASVSDSTLERLVEVLNRMLGRLEQAFRARRRFLDDASHELRTPLAALRAELELALRRPRSPQAYREALGRALEDVNHLIELAEALLLVARAGGPLRLQGGVELFQVAEAALRRCRPAALHAGVELVNRVPRGLAIPGDPLALERVVVNLVNNGIAACTPGGQVVVDATQEARDGRAGVLLVVADDGQGIPPQEQERIFERFYRRAGGGEAGGGTGLGLAIVREVVLAHGGTVEVESSPGRGTRMKVWLPGLPNQP